MSNTRENIGYLLVRVCRALRSYRTDRLARHGLHCGQDLLLIEVGKETGLTQSDLCERLEVEPPTVTKMVHRMERSGTVVRKPDTKDARIVRLFLTEQGQDLLDEINVCWDEVEQVTLQGFSAEEQTLMQHLLRKILANLDPDT